MRALLGREFRSYFQNRVGFVFISVYLALFGILVTRYNFIYASASLGYALYDMIPLFALVVPMLTVKLFSAERKSGAYRLLYSLPIKLSHIVIAKYLALVALWAIPFAVSLALPLVFNFLGEVNFLNCYTALALFFLLGCAVISLCVFISSLSDNAAISVAVSYSTLILLYFANMLRVSFADGALREVLSSFTLFGDFEDLIYGTFDVTAAVYYISVSVIFVFLTVVSVKRRALRGDVRKDKKISSNAAVALLVAIVLVLNVSLSFLPKRYTEADLTPDGMYSISDETEKLLDSVDGEVVFYLLNADGSNGKFETFLRKYVERGKNIRLEHVNTSSDKSFLTSRGYSADTEVSPYTLFIESSARSQAVGFYDMVSYTNQTFGELTYSEYYYYHTLFASNETYADYLEQLVYYSQMNFNGEAVISGIVEYVALDTVKLPYFITGHGENSATGGNIAKLLSAPACDISAVDSIPVDADFIIINEPTEDYTERERDIVLDYLKSGGCMVLITDEDNLSMKNLMSIAEYYGMSSSVGLIGETDGEEGVKYTISPVLNPDHDVFSALDSLDISITNATAINISGDLRSSQLVTPIVTSSEKAYIGEAQNTGVFNVGVAVEEECPNAITKIVWFTGADSFNGEGASQNELTLPIYAMAWMSEPYASTLGEIDSSVYEGLPLDITAKVALWFGIIGIAIIPMTVFAAGYVWYKKRNRA